MSVVMWLRCVSLGRGFEKKLRWSGEMTVLLSFSFFCKVAGETMTN